MNVKITEYKEVEADLSEASFEEIDMLFLEFMEELYANISKKKFKKILKSAERLFENYKEEMSVNLKLK